MSRVGHRQLALLYDSLSERDLAVLESIRAWRLLNARQLDRLHFADHATDDSGGRVRRRIMQRLNNQQLVRRLDRTVGGVRAGSTGHIYALTPLAHRLLGHHRRRRWHEPGPTFVDHTLAISELGSLAIRAALTAGQEVLRVEPEPASWRPFTDGETRVVLKPDLFLQIADAETEHSWFIEIDRDTESLTVIEAKNQRYTRHWQTGVEQHANGVYPRVLWVAPTQRRADAIASTFSRRGTEPRLFIAATTTTALNLLVPTNTKEDSRTINQERTTP